MSYDYDLIVVGGGSGGLAASKEAMAVNPNLRVACFDYVKPSPHGTKWGLGGTCVNVGCIPKKLMHYCGLLGHSFEYARQMGWKLTNTVQHDWPALVDNVDNYIRSLNFGYIKALRESRVKYFNAYARFVDEHTVEYEEKGQVKRVTADKFIIAVGGRPRYPNCKGANLGITSDDIFWRKTTPGKTLIVGASYIALECASFLHELGYDVTVMVRSILLRGFDQQCASQIGEFMEREGVRFLQPKNICYLEKNESNNRIKVSYADTTIADMYEKNQNIDEIQSHIESDEYDTVIWAIGRDACVSDIGIQNINLQISNGKIVTNEYEQTSTSNIYAIGDVCKDRPELTPVAIQAGQLLAKRLFNNSNKLMDYINVPTVVFTGLEYGACGYSQEDAEKKYGKDNLVVYASRFGVLEGASTFQDIIPPTRSQCFTHNNLYHRLYIKANGGMWEDYELNSWDEEERARKFMKQPCLAKLVCDKNQNNRVVGFHYVGPNAGEITQGFALAVRLGATKEDFDNLVGIHPTAAEEFTTLSTQMNLGDDFMKSGGC